MYRNQQRRFLRKMEIRLRNDLISFFFIITRNVSKINRRFFFWDHTYLFSEWQVTRFALALELFVSSKKYDLELKYAVVSNSNCCKSCSRYTIFKCLWLYNVRVVSNYSKLFEFQ